MDGSGNAYVTGYTTSQNFPVTTGVVQSVYGGGPIDVFVTELNPAGTALVYSTYLGGSGDDEGTGIALDTQGNAYVTVLPSGRSWALALSRVRPPLL